MEDASHLNFIPFNINAAVQRKKAVSATERILHQSAFSVFVNYSYNVIMMPDIRIKLTIMQRMQLVLTTESVSHNELSGTSRYLDFAKMEPMDILSLVCF